MNLLLSSGHPNADNYPIGRVFDETRLLVDRRNGEMATLGVLIQAATMTTGMGANRKSIDHFKKIIKGLSGDT